jgi:precorrin-6B methylase 1
MTVCSLLRKIQDELNKINEGKGSCGVLAAGVSCFDGAEVHLNENVFQAVFSDDCPTISPHSDEYNKLSVAFDGVKIFTLVEKATELKFSHLSKRRLSAKRSSFN